MSYVCHPITGTTDLLILLNKMDETVIETVQVKQ